MTFDVEFDLDRREENVLVLELKIEEPQILIGEQGKTLNDIQKILGRLLRKATGEEIYLDLDVNQYKKNKIKYLKEVAQELADRVALEKKEKALFPMNSYERRIIHLELAERTDIKTESIGEDQERRVVIKPA